MARGREVRNRTEDKTMNASPVIASPVIASPVIASPVIASPDHVTLIITRLRTSGIGSSITRLHCGGLIVAPIRPQDAPAGDCEAPRPHCECDLCREEREAGTPPSTDTFYFTPPISGSAAAMPRAVRAFEK
jgi:hypothetical protein